MTNGNDSIHNSEQGTQDGLTKREYFAAMALQGIYASYSGIDTIPPPSDVCYQAVFAADALIEALNKEK